LKVFITGASGGIGAALAAHYAGQGALLGLCARRAGIVGALLARLGGKGASYQVDVTDAGSVQEAARDFAARFGAPDIVIANAGISVGTSAENSDDLAAFRKVMDTNVYGMAATFQPFVESMRERRSGTLVGIASVAGFRGLPGAGAYGASKAAAMTYLESLRVELHPSGVSVVTVCPGYVRTPMTAVNRYRMPFILEADEAARRIERVISRKRRLAVIPWQMALASCAFRSLPGWLYDRVFAHAPRKPRNLIR
jgi:NAD(P)-dependent dehydrogenase (short-subunit alcohol dehydrogenase family)